MIYNSRACLHPTVPHCTLCCVFFWLVLCFWSVFLKVLFVCLIGFVHGVCKSVHRTACTVWLQWSECMISTSWAGESLRIHRESGRNPANTSSVCTHQPSIPKNVLQAGYGSLCTASWDINRVKEKHLVLGMFLFGTPPSGTHFTHILHTAPGERWCAMNRKRPHIILVLWVHLPIALARILLPHCSQKIDRYNHQGKVVFPCFLSLSLSDFCALPKTCILGCPLPKCLL